jgi:hypothetical protein
MTGPIFSLWMMRYTQAWYALAPDAREKLMEQVMQALTDTGGEFLFAYQTIWSNERWQWFGVERYPDLEAVNQHAMKLYAIDWYNYVDSQVFLGTETAGFAYQKPEESGGKALYKMYVMRPNQAGFAATQEQSTAILAKMEQARNKVGLKILLGCACDWSSEPWVMFGVEQFASLEAEQEYTHILAEIGWLHYIEVFTLLGLEMPG